MHPKITHTLSSQQPADLQLHSAAGEGEHSIIPLGPKVGAQHHRKPLGDIGTQHHRKRRGDSSLGILGSCPDLVVTIPSHVFQSGHQKLFGNKLGLAFESDQDTQQTLEWLATFNLESSISLTLSDILPYSHFVVQFDSSVGDVAKQDLIKCSPLNAINCDK